MCVKLLQLGLTLCDRMACQTPLSMGFPGQEYWYGLPFPSPSGMCSVQFSCSVVSDSLRPHELQHARPPCPITNSRSSLILISIESMMPSSHLILCHPLLLLPSIFPSSRVFSNQLALCIRWPKIGASVSASVLPMNIQG